MIYVFLKEKTMSKKGRMRNRFNKTFKAFYMNGINIILFK